MAYDESQEILENANHESVRMRYKRIQSQILDRNELWKQVAHQISDFSEDDYDKLKPFVLEQDIPTIQSHIRSGDLTYTTLAQ